jgi:hypothetical protein
MSVIVWLDIPGWVMLVLVSRMTQTATLLALLSIDGGISLMFGTIL